MKRIKRQPADDPTQTLLFDADVYFTRCKRRLKGDASCRRRYGPGCWKRVQAKARAACS